MAGRRVSLSVMKCTFTQTDSIRFNTQYRHLFGEFFSSKEHKYVEFSVLIRPFLSMGKGIWAQIKRPLAERKALTHPEQENIHSLVLWKNVSASWRRTIGIAANLEALGFTARE